MDERAGRSQSPLAQPQKRSPRLGANHPSLPRKINALVDEARRQEMRDAYIHLVKVQQRQSLWLAAIAVVLLLILLLK
ncbi:hypothetical protein ACFFKZ_12430 [Neisseria gonorrhoeae]